MRLPQSSRQYSCVFVIAFALLAALNLSQPAQAATTQQLLCSPSSLRFGTVPLGQSESQIVSLTNSGQSAVTVSAVGVNDAEFSISGLTLPQTLAAGQSVTFNVAFAPTGGGWAGGKVTFTSNASNPNLQLQLAGTGVTSDALTAAPSSLAFGQVAVGATSTLAVVLTNARTWKETLTAIQAGGTSYSVSAPTLPLTLSAGQSITVNVTFTPLAAGLTGGNIFVSGPSIDIPLSGTGTTTGQLTIAPGALSFGNVMVGETSTQSTNLSATGGSVTVSSASSSNSQFAMPGASFPLTIAAGQSVAINVAFTPKSNGASSATLSFSSNASNSHASESVAGTGTPPEVSLSWSASISQVSGYNVYRRVAPSGTYAKVNSTLDPSTSFLDTTVVGGQTYDYATTAVTSGGEESSYSNQVEIAVP